MKIAVDALSKSYNKKSVALDKVSFEINGGVFGLLGRNGAGKTTLMRIMATAIKPSHGRVMFEGKDIFGNLKEFRSNLGYLPQNTSLMPSMNIREFLDYVCVLKNIKSKTERKAEIDRCLEIVGLENEGKKHLSKFSGGMLRRAGIAQALLGSPSLLIIDEPTTGLDPEERLYFLNLLSRISATQTTVFSTHIIHDIESICENICVLEKGKLMYTGTTKTMIEKIDGKVWECLGNPGDELNLKEKAVVVSVAYEQGKPLIRYISETPVADGSNNVKGTLENAYIYTLGGIKR